jgi:predicted Zn-ribbon and HTH transcriptional regulator
MVSPGPHAFLIVISAAHRFTEEEQKTIEYINEMFGSDAGRYCILIITREEEILNDDKTVDQYLQESDEPLKRLVAQCQNRYIAINNRSEQTERDAKVRQLVNIVRNMLKENRTPYYANEMFKQAEKEFEEKEIETLNKIKAKTEAQMQNLREEVRITHF